MFGFEFDLGGVKYRIKGKCCIAAMRRVHGYCGDHLRMHATRWQLSYFVVCAAQ